MATKSIRKSIRITFDIDVVSCVGSIGERVKALNAGKFWKLDDDMADFLAEHYEVYTGKIKVKAEKV